MELPQLHSAQRPPEIHEIVAALGPRLYERLYGVFGPSVVSANARTVVRRSAERYLRRMEGRISD